jgi:hypothetical protein
MSEGCHARGRGTDQFCEPTGSVYRIRLSLNHGKYRHWIELDSDQFSVWRLAWDLLLQNLILEEICEELHRRGYRLRTGRPFVEIQNGKRKQLLVGFQKIL